METEQIDLLVAKNQISFDFDALNEEEESSCLPQHLIKSVNHNYVKDEVLFVVAKAYNEKLVKNLPNLCICGKTLTDWVLMAGSGCECKIVDEQEDMINLLKNIQTNKPIIALFYSDTPLMDRPSFFDIIDHFSSKGINYLKLSRGLIIKTSYLSRLSDELLATSSYECKNLFRVDSAKRLAVANSVLQERILNYHISNGVVIIGQNVEIDADVEIEPGVVIYSNNSILGSSVISSGAVLKSGNFIKNSIVASDCVLESSYIENSMISCGKVIEGKAKIINEKV